MICGSGSVKVRMLIAWFSTLLIVMRIISIYTVFLRQSLGQNKITFWVLISQVLNNIITVGLADF